MKPNLIKIIVLLIMLFLQPCVYGQAIRYEALSFSDALKKAKHTKQIVFVQMVSDCEECNTVADKGLSGDDVAAIFSRFICIRVLPGSDDYLKISEQYRISPVYPTSLFLNHEGHMLEIMYNLSTSQTSEYVKHTAMAMANRNKPPLAKYVKKYSSGNYDIGFLEEYILKLLEYRFNTDDLLEEYVGQLTIDSLFSENKLKFIMKAAPIIDSRIYKLIRFDHNYFDSIFMSLPLKERVMINNRIIQKSRQKAYQEKNMAYMHKVANYTQGTYRDYQKGNQAYTNNMLDFYKEIKDTTRYILFAESYYERHIKELDMDSICKIEKESYIDIKDGKRIMGGRLLKVGNQINKMAWTIYELTDDPEHLGMALKWAESVLIYQNPAYHDTYAHILYKLGAKEKAIEWQQKAIELSDSLNHPNEDIKLELSKMKQGKL